MPVAPMTRPSVSIRRTADRPISDPPIRLCRGVKAVSKGLSGLRWVWCGIYIEEFEFQNANFNPTRRKMHDVGFTRINLLQIGKINRQSQEALRQVRKRTVRKTGCVCPLPRVGRGETLSPRPSGPQAARNLIDRINSGGACPASRNRRRAGNALYRRGPVCHGCVHFGRAAEGQAAPHAFAAQAAFGVDDDGTATLEN